MTARESFRVTVLGEVYDLPLDWATQLRLEDAGLCVTRLAILATGRGEPLVLTMGQACKALAIGMTAAGKPTTDVQLRDRLRASSGEHVKAVSAAMLYLGRIAADMRTDDQPAVEEGSDPK